MQVSHRVVLGLCIMGQLHPLDAPAGSQSAEHGARVPHIADVEASVLHQHKARCGAAVHHVAL